jgi:putative inorganic carbon (HCO3(-)) transporter
MRDFIIIAMVVIGALIALRKPWIGVLLWTWLSIMNPHRYAYGMAYDAPLAAMAAVSVFIGFLITKDKETPFKGAPVIWFSLFIVWVTISWLLGLDVAGDYDQWSKVMKIDVMILIALMLLNSKKHIMALMWVCVISIAALGAKGGLFSLLNGGGDRVWGPPGSFIEDNNAFAVAVIMTIPLLRFLQLQINSAVGKKVLTVVMLLCAVSGLGSQSRGALLAISAMALYLWFNSKNKFGMGFMLFIVAIPLMYFMPDSWFDRMHTIGTYDEDQSAMGRISAWWNSWNLAFHYPFGVGFNAATPELFAKFSPYPDQIQGAHSIYFLALGNHGFIGLALFLGIWINTWRSASWLANQKNLVPEAKWCNELGSLCQVSLVAYFVGGAFLNLTYFDLPYYVMVIVVVTRMWVNNKGWEKESDPGVGWTVLPGLVPARK